MKLVRTIIILVAMTITMLFVWQANSPAFAKSGAPSCRGANLLVELRSSEPKAYEALIAREKKVINGKGLLWKIERPGTPASYLYGTMHMSDERLTKLPGPVNEALMSTDTVVLEVDEVLDEKRMQAEVVKNIALIAFTDGRTLDSVLSGNQLKLLKNTLKKYKMPYAASRILKPWFVMLSVAMPVCEVQRQQAGYKALDAEIARKGQKNGAKVIGLETVKEQFSVFGALSEQDQISFLMSTLRMNHLLDDQIETMKQLYLQRRPAALWEFALYLTRKDVTENTKSSKGGKSFGKVDMLKKFERELVVKRNKIMRDRALPMLENGNLFIAVGAAHLPDKHGLVTLLRESGYKLSLVY